MRTPLHSLPLCLFTLAGIAAASDVAGPVSGFVYDDSAKAIRPLLGIPGASLVGEPLDLGFTVARAAVAPAQDFFLAVDSDGGVRLVRRGAKAVNVGALHGAPERIVFSPAGSAALFLSAAGVDVYTGLPGSPALARTLADLASGPASAWAVSDDGRAVLAVAGGSVWLAGGSAEWKSLAEAGENARLAFAPASRDAVVAQAARTTLYRDVEAGGEVSTFEAEEGALAPAAAAFTADGRILLAAGRGVQFIDPADSSRTALACDCEASVLFPLGPLFRLNELAGAPLWLLDARREEPRIVFVPAPQARAVAPSETQ